MLLIVQIPLLASHETRNHAHPTREKYRKMKQHDTSYMTIEPKLLMEEILHYLRQKKWFQKKQWNSYKCGTNNW